MSQALLDELKRENLCTHFILPLLKLNKLSFIASNFLNCYLSPEGDMIIVRIVDTQLLSRRMFVHPEYRGLRENQDKDIYMVYQVPPKWKPDVHLFMQGKFSQMSKAAKDTIVRHSGLPFHERTRGSNEILTDGRLLALERHKLLKEMWENMLSSTDNRPTGRVQLDQQGELLSIPGEESYLDPNTLRVIQPRKS